MKWISRAAILAALFCMLTVGAFAEGALNVLLIGVDANDLGTHARSDTMMLARIDPEAGEVRLVSFLRDLYVPIAGHGRTRLNAAYAFGGADLLTRTLAEQFGVPIHRTVTVSYALLMELVDDLGGVTLEVTEAERRQLNEILESYNAQLGQSATQGALKEAGFQLLTGKQALCFSRIRKLDSDFGRTSRQQRVIAAMLSRLSAAPFWQQASFAATALTKVETTLTLRDIQALLSSARAIASKGEAAIQTAQVPFEGTYAEEVIGGMMVLVPDLDANRRKLDAFLAGE